MKSYPKPEISAQVAAIAPHTINLHQATLTLKPTEPTLTKRELFATAMMQGILSSGDFYANPEKMNELTEYAVAYADSLICHLDGDSADA